MVRVMARGDAEGGLPDYFEAAAKSRARNTNLLFSDITPTPFPQHYITNKYPNLNSRTPYPLPQSHPFTLIAP
jgi:hypothetical protein